MTFWVQVSTVLTIENHFRSQYLTFGFESVNTPNPKTTRRHLNLTNLTSEQPQNDLNYPMRLFNSVSSLQSLE